MRRIIKRLVDYILCKPENSINIEFTQLSDEEMLSGQKILIVGGSKGIGLECAKRFLLSGAKVCITGRDNSFFKGLQFDNRVFFLEHDIRDIQKIEMIIKKAEDLLGGELTSLVLNAGVSLHEENITQVTENNYDLQFDTNIKGAFFFAKEFTSLVFNRTRADRSILFISSETADLAYDIPYGLTKASINNLITGLSHRLYKYGCRVNGISPGVTLTDMERLSGIDIDEIYGIARSNSAGRMFMPEEIAEVALFLLSNRSLCISGEVIHCNANNHIRPPYQVNC